MMLGHSITSFNDPLQRISIKQLYHELVQGTEEQKVFCEQLKRIATIDKKSYQELKKKLPYIVCGLFHPPFRRKENFASIQFFIVDIDHLENHEQTAKELKNSLTKDDEVFMVFISPSGNGLKVMFRLIEPCTDANLFSFFYKKFISTWAIKHRLESFIDFSTSDVTRACFIGIDSETYGNSKSLFIDIKTYVGESLDYKEIKAIGSTDSLAKVKSGHESIDITDDVLVQIKLKLGQAKVIKKKEVIVSEEVDGMMDKLAKIFQEFNIRIRKSDAINYGRKVVIEAKDHWAEINIFYGKKGYSVVETTKSGSTKELAILGKQIIQKFLN